jgi:hypothetical protein
LVATCLVRPARVAKYSYLSTTLIIVDLINADMISNVTLCSKSIDTPNS